MILISHRGNLNGKNKEKENSPDYITEALTLGFDVEVDIWFMDNSLWLGHDSPEYKINLNWINERKEKLWIHCKNLQAIEFVNWFKGDINLNYFWHETDTVTLTSKGYIWAYPGYQPIRDSIAVLPELNKEEILECAGICSDYITEYRTKIDKIC